MTKSLYDIYFKPHRWYYCLIGKHKWYQYAAIRVPDCINRRNCVHCGKIIELKDKEKDIWGKPKPLPHSLKLPKN